MAEIRLPLSDLDVTYLNLPEESQTEPRVLLESQVSGVDAQWLGKLVRTEGVLDEASRVIYGVVQVEDPYNLKGQTHEEPLRFGRFVQAQIEGQQVSGVMEVPTYAINPTALFGLLPMDASFRRKRLKSFGLRQIPVLLAMAWKRSDLVVLTQLKNALNGMKIRLEGDPLPEQMETSANNEETVAANDNEQGE